MILRVESNHTSDNKIKSLRRKQRKSSKNEIVLEVNIERVSELMCIGGSFEVLRQIVQEADGSG